MAEVQIEVGGRRYQVACRDGGEERLRELGRLVDARAADVIRAIGKGNEPRELLMTALLLADELDEARSAVAAHLAEEETRIAAVLRCAELIDALAAGLEHAAPLENGERSA